MTDRACEILPVRAAWSTPGVRPRSGPTSPPRPRSRPALTTTFLSPVRLAGYNGYCRLGLTDQKDRLVPTIVPQFARENKLLRAKFVSCGPANTVRRLSSSSQLPGRAHDGLTDDDD